MGTDKNADVLWIGNSWGGNLDPHRHQDAGDARSCRCRARCSRITSRSTASTTPGSTCGPRTASCGYDPATNTWTTFDLPTRGTEARYISVTEHTGALQVVVPYSRTSKVAVMSLRSEADLAALKAQAGK